MDQNLVDHDLEEKRRHKREQLEEKGCDEHLAEKVPIFVDRAQEPSEIETSAKVAQSRPSSHQDQAAVPDRKQFVAGHQGRTGSLRPLNQHLVVGRLGDDHERAVVERRNRRQWCFDKSGPVGSSAARLQSKVLGAPENFRCANRLFSDPVEELITIRGNAVEVQQHHEGIEPRLG